MRVKMSKQPPPAPTASAVGPCPTIIKSVGRPGTGSLPRTIAPPDHPRQRGRSAVSAHWDVNCPLKILAAELFAKIGDRNFHCFHDIHFSTVCMNIRVVFNGVCAKITKNSASILAIFVMEKKQLFIVSFNSVFNY